MSGVRPPGWTKTTLGEVVDILDRLRVPVNADDRSGRQGTVPYYGATGQVGWIDKHIFDEELVLLGEDGAPFLDPSKAKAYMVRGKSWVNNHAHVLRGKGVSNAFLMHQLNAIDYHGAVTGTTRLKLPQGPMKKLPVLVPPRDEQDRIVAEIEKQFTRLDAGVAALERLRGHLRRYRAAVLKDAFRPGWPLVALGSLIREPLRNGHSAPKSATGVGIRTLTLSAVTDGVFTDDNTKITSADAARVRDLWLRAGDILIERSNTPELVGTARVYRGPNDWAIFPDLLIRARLKPEVSDRFVEHFFASERARNYFRRSAQGIAGSMPKISQPTIEALMVPLPPLSVQHEASATLDLASSQADAIECAWQNATNRSSRLRAALLRSAFEARLIAPEQPARAPAA